VYYDEGAGNFSGDFTHDVDFNVTDPGGRMGLWALSNSIGDITTFTDEASDTLVIFTKDLYDYGTYTETDSDGRIATTDSVVTVTDLDTDEDVYLYRDMDTDCIELDDDFEHRFNFQCTDSQSGICGLWAVSNDDPANGNGLYGLAANDLDHLSLRHEDGGNDSYTKLLLHFDGTGGSQVFTDSSDQDHTMYAGDEARLDTDYSKFSSSASGYFDGINDYIYTTNDSSSFFQSTDPFTIDFWIRFNDTTQDSYLFTHWQDDENNVTLAYDYTVTGGSLSFIVKHNNVDTISQNVTFVPTTDTWYHYSLIRGWGGVSTTFQMTIDGAGQTGSWTGEADQWPDLTANFRIGGYGDDYFNGWIEEFRLSKGIARWTSNFTVPSRAYGHYLWLQETNGAADATDSSVGLSGDTNYYVTVKRDEDTGTYGTLYAYIYSDISRSTLEDTLTVTLTEKQDFRFLYGMISYDGATGGATWDGTIENLGNHPWLVLREINGATYTQVETSEILSEDTDYYLTLDRDESVGTFGTLYAHLFSDEARSTTLETLTLTLTEKQDFRYIYGAISWDDATPNNTWSGTISNLTGDIYDTILNGFHFKKDQPSESHILVQVENADGTQKIFDNTTAIPDQGTFDTTALYTDSSGAGRGRFVSAPQGNMVYCNGVESLIWAGDEGRCAAFIISTASPTTTVSDAKDFTDQIQNTLTTSDEVVSLATPYLAGVVGSTRPLKGVKFEIETPNDTASTINFEEWTGDGWSPLTETDNTSLTGIALATSDTVTWATTEDTSKPLFLEGRSLYWYRWELTAGTSTISHVTVDAPIQDIRNIWSGDSSTVAACKKYDNLVYTDYSVEVNDSVTSTVAVLDDLATSQYLLLGFLTPQQGFEIFIPPGKGNSNANTLTVNYWDGNSFEAVDGLNDGTHYGASALSESGVISFTAPDRGSEFPTTIAQEGPYYYYQIKPVSVAMDDETEIYYITGIEAPDKVAAYKFAVDFQTRTLLCGSDEAPSSVRISAENAPDVYNGEDSTTLYFGGDDDLVAGIGLYNRHGSSLYNYAVFCKRSEAWTLSGFDPDSFEKKQVSDTVGCVAPMTMKTFEFNRRGAGGAAGYNVVAWLDYSGPVMFNGSVPFPIEGIEPYFDPSDSRCVNYDAIENSVGLADPLLKHYSLGIPSGAGQTTINTWPVYDWDRDKWFKKEPPEYPQCMFLAEDTDGARYGFLGFADGYIRHNENGTSFDGEDIDQELTLRDILPTQSMWLETRIDFLKLMAVSKSGDNIDNGDMELDSNWSNYYTPTANERSSTQAHGGTYSRKFTSDGAFDGIRSDTYTTITGEDYTIDFWVYPDDAAFVTIDVDSGNGTHLTGLTHSVTQDAWNSISYDVTETAGGDNAAIYISDGVGSTGDWYIDDVTITGAGEAIGISHRSDGDTDWTELTDVPMYVEGKRYQAHIQRPNELGVSHEFKLSASTDDIENGMEPLAFGILFHPERTTTIPTN
jgi:hypothetical protein